MGNTSPVIKKENKEEVLNSIERVSTQTVPMTFPEAMQSVIDGKKITRLEWDDPRHYGLLEHGILSLHKAGEAGDVFYSWIINDGDLLSKDWMIVLTDIN